MGFLSRSHIEEMNFAHVGSNVFISDKASIYNCNKISIGDNVRIDDFCVISAGSGGIEIGSYVHIAVYASLIGAGKITVGDFSGISSRVSIYSSNDDYSGTSMTNPMVPKELTDVVHADVTIEKHVIIGSGSVVLPGVVLEEGVAVGALSLVSKTCKAYGIYSGAPARRIKERKKEMLELENKITSRIK